MRHRNRHARLREEVRSVLQLEERLALRIPPVLADTLGVVELGLLLRRRRSLRGGELLSC